MADNDDILILKVTVEINFMNAKQFEKSIYEYLENEPQKIGIDMAEVPTIDSSGIAALIEILKKIKGYGGELILHSLSPETHASFQAAKLDTFFKIMSQKEFKFKFLFN